MPYENRSDASCGASNEKPARAGWEPGAVSA